MPILQWKGKRAYAVHSQQIEGKRRIKWVPLGYFDRKSDAHEKFAEHIQLNDTRRQNKQILFGDIVEPFMAYRKNNKSETTYLHDRNHMVALIKKFKDTRLKDIDAAAIEKWKHENEWADTTWRNRLTLLKQAFDYARDHGFEVPKSPFKIISIPRPKLWEFLPRMVVESDLIKFINALDEPFKSIALILRYTGMRPKELSLLKKEDITKDKIRVVSTKVKRTRYIPIHKKIKPLLKLIPLEKSQDMIAREFHRVSNRVGVTVTPYMLRHQFASDIVNKTGNIRAAQQLLGHSTIQMTTRYAHNTDETLINAIGIL
jgi:integrase